MTTKKPIVDIFLCHSHSDIIQVVLIGTSGTCLETNTDANDCSSLEGFVSGDHTTQDMMLGWMCSVSLGITH